uniref:Uncharacterized protein n=1 Tax=Colobus angolensis palliatus TaxID=336983 RepID=A0A2K5JM49_COLAP
MTSPAAAQSQEIDCLRPEAQRLAEARLAAKLAARAEAREIRMKELERQQKEVEEGPEKDFTEKGSGNMPGLSAATLASLVGSSSRRGSLHQGNKELSSRKGYGFQCSAAVQREKEFEREKHAHSILQFQFAEVKEALKQREEMLKKHGIILNSEIAANGETSETRNNVGYQGPTKMTKEGLNALKSTGDGTLGRASEVEMKNEIMANDIVKDFVDIEVFPAGENTEDQKSSEDTAPFLGTLAGATYEEQVQSQILERASLPENTAQVESNEVMGAPDDGTRTPLEPSNCWSDLDGGSHIENVGKSTVTQVGEQAGTVALCPLKHSDDTVYHDDKCTVELETSTGHSLDKEFINQEAAEPKEFPVHSTEVGRDHNEEEGEETGLRDEKPIKTEVPGSAAGTESNGQEATGPSTVDTQSKPLDTKESDEEKTDQKGDTLDSSQKTKNKRKKNKKKKSPVPSAVEAQNEKIAAESSENVDCPENPKIKLNGKLDQEGDDVKAAAEEVLADGDTLDFEDVTVQSSSPRAGGEESDESVAKDNAKIDGATQSSPVEPESEDTDRWTLPKNESPSQDISDACEAESTERCGKSEHPSQTVRKALDSNSLENDDLAPGGEPGDFNPESREDTRGGNEKDKGKEDCTIS